MSFHPIFTIEIDTPPQDRDAAFELLMKVRHAAGVFIAAFNRHAAKPYSEIIMHAEDELVAKEEVQKIPGVSRIHDGAPKSKK